MFLGPTYSVSDFTLESGPDGFFVRKQGRKLVRNYIINEKGKR